MYLCSNVENNILVMLMEGPVKYTPIESEVDELLRKSVLYIQSYRTIEAQNVLNKALRLVESNKEVRWQLKCVTYRNLGDSYVQMGLRPPLLKHYSIYTFFS